MSAPAPSIIEDIMSRFPNSDWAMLAAQSLVAMGHFFDIFYEYNKTFKLARLSCLISGDSGSSHKTKAKDYVLNIFKTDNVRGMADTTPQGLAQFFVDAAEKEGRANFLAISYDGGDILKRIRNNKGHDNICTMMNELWDNEELPPRMIAQYKCPWIRGAKLSLLVLLTPAHVDDSWSKEFMDGGLLYRMLYIDVPTEDFNKNDINGYVETQEAWQGFDMFPLDLIKRVSAFCTTKFYCTGDHAAELAEVAIQCKDPSYRSRWVEHGARIASIHAVSRYIASHDGIFGKKVAPDDARIKIEPEDYEFATILLWKSAQSIEKLKAGADIDKDIKKALKIFEKRGGAMTRREFGRSMGRTKLQADPIISTLVDYYGHVLKSTNKDLDDPSILCPDDGAEKCKACPLYNRCAGTFVPKKKRGKKEDD